LAIRLVADGGPLKGGRTAPACPPDRSASATGQQNGSPRQPASEVCGRATKEDRAYVRESRSTMRVSADRLSRSLAAVRGPLARSVVAQRERPVKPRGTRDDRPVSFGRSGWLPYPN